MSTVSVLQYDTHRYDQKWNRKLSTQGSEMEFFCNKSVDFEKFITSELKTFKNENNCWFGLIKDKNLFTMRRIDEKYFKEKDKS